MAFTATATLPGNALMVASVSANEPETSSTDNEVTHTITVGQNRSNENTGNTSQPMSSGTGSAGWTLLMLLALLLFSAPAPLRRHLPQH